MSRATSGSDIFFDKSAMRFSSSAISVSMISGLRGFLMILTRDAPPADAACPAFPLPRFDPLAGKDVLFTRPEPSATADGSDFLSTLRGPPATAGGSDLPAFQS